jgi:sugar porter (SP) family MFS transporter
MGAFPLVQAVKEKGNRFVFGLATVAAIGGFLFGYDTGVISGALLFIKQDFHAGKLAQQAIVAAVLVGAVVGAIASGYLADRISRRWTKFLSGCVYVVGAIAAALSQNSGELIGARFVLGLAVGTASFVSPMYIAELAPRKIRGGTVSFNQMMIVLGILLAYIADWALKGAPNNWRWMFGLAAIPGAALAIGMLLLPHTPRWLLQQGRRDDARRVLRRARKRDDIEGEIEDIEAVAEQHGRLRDVFKPAVRPMLVVGLALAIFQQMVGVNTVIYYAPTILSFTGISAAKSVTLALFVGVTNVVFTLVAVMLLDRVGRRPLLLTGTVGVLISLVVLGVFFEVSWLQQHASVIALLALITFIASFAIGLGPVFWLMISEIFPLSVRGPAMSICAVANWGFSFLISVTFLSLTSAIGRSFTFWLYGAFAVVAIAFFAARVPETRGRSLEEIERDITGGEPGAEVHTGTPQETGDGREAVA